MKKESEKKKPTAIRLSDDERRIVEAKAKAKGMTLSSYITFMAVHGSKAFLQRLWYGYRIW